MKNPANSNIYEANARNVLEAYAAFVEGTPESLLLAVCDGAPSASACEALASSAERLGFRRSIAWLRLSDKASGASAAAAPELEAAPASAIDPASAPEPAPAADPESAAAADHESAPEPAPALGADDVFAIVEGIDPIALVALDAASCRMLADAYRCDVPQDAHCRIFGRDAAAFRDFTAMLTDEDAKQRAWAILKRLQS